MKRSAASHPGLFYQTERNGASIDVSDCWTISEVLQQGIIQTNRYLFDIRAQVLPIHEMIMAEGGPNRQFFRAYLEANKATVILLTRRNAYLQRILNDPAGSLLDPFRPGKTTRYQSEAKTINDHLNTLLIEDAVWSNIFLYIDEMSFVRDEAERSATSLRRWTDLPIGMRRTSRRIAELSDRFVNAAIGILESYCDCAGIEYEEIEPATRFWRPEKPLQLRRVLLERIPAPDDPILALEQQFEPVPREFFS